ncbi:MAG: OmpA family protein [Elusimicrobia bacterium]|nr:OmpA family protein [Elusimicrobiota bacterium]
MRFYEREDELENELNRGALWAITYGDMMSYLMIFFMMLFTLYSTKDIAPQFIKKAVEDEFGLDTKTTEKLFDPKKGIQQIATVEISANKITIKFADPILFEPGNDRLKPSSLPHLKMLVDVFNNLPNPVQIEGHTDDRPLGKHTRFKSNWELSAARAFSVLKYFLGQGIAPEKLSAVGYGEFKPVKSNDTPEGRSSNRRIEVNIIRHEI